MNDNSSAPDQAPADASARSAHEAAASGGATAAPAKTGSTAGGTHVSFDGTLDKEGISKGLEGLLAQTGAGRPKGQ